MEIKKICPFMGGNVCREEMCALWPQVGKVCSLTQIGASLASINGSGLSVESMVECDSELRGILRNMEEDLDEIARTV